METIRELIQRLQRQSDQQAVPSELLATVHELETALRQAMTEPVRQVRSGNISVVLPSGNRLHTSPTPVAEEAKPEKAEEIRPAVIQAEPVMSSGVEATEVLPVQKSAPVEESRYRPIPSEDSKYVPVQDELPKPSNVDIPRFRKPEESRIFEAPAPAPGVAENFHLSFEKEEEAKKNNTSQQMEMNDIFSQTHSLNDRMKGDQKEIGSSLHEEPVKDLRRAIGINDRFVYLSELFRGDEVMYERSLKTINNFRIYPEAEYWIERELKVKLGWDENKGDGEAVSVVGETEIYGVKIPFTMNI